MVLASAVTGEGIEALRRAISDRMTSGNAVHRLSIPASDGASLAWLHEYGEVLDIREGEGEMLSVSVRLSDAAHARFRARKGDQEAPL